MPRRVFLCDDHAVVRAGLKALLDQEPGLSVVGEAGDGVAAVEEIIALRPDVALPDITMPGIDGLEVAHRCAAGRPAAGADHARRLRLPLPGASRPARPATCSSAPPRAT